MKNANVLPFQVQEMYNLRKHFLVTFYNLVLIISLCLLFRIIEGTDAISKAYNQSIVTLFVFVSCT